MWNKKTFFIKLSGLKLHRTWEWDFNQNPVFLTYVIEMLPFNEITKTKI